MIVDTSEDSRIEVDGDVVQPDGTFVFEDGFEQSDRRDFGPAFASERCERAKGGIGTFVFEDGFEG
jgi:hypothetical protein